VDQAVPANIVLAEARRRGIPAVLGHRFADAIYSFGRFRPRAQATVQSAPTVWHSWRLAASATAGLRSAARCLREVPGRVSILQRAEPRFTGSFIQQLGSPLLRRISKPRFCHLFTRSGDGFVASVRIPSDADQRSEVMAIAIPN
jgi:hypothetical protein